MSLPEYGRVTPLQMDMLMLAGEDVLNGGTEAPSDMDRVRVMKEARESLKKLTGVDFGYDLSAWNKFLLNSPELSKEYKFRYAWKAVKRRIEEIIDDPHRVRLIEMVGMS
jgi:hypothetical protein